MSSLTSSGVWLPTWAEVKSKFKIKDFWKITDNTTGAYIIYFISYYTDGLANGEASFSNHFAAATLPVLIALYCHWRIVGEHGKKGRLIFWCVHKAEDGLTSVCRRLFQGALLGFGIITFAPILFDVGYIFVAPSVNWTWMTILVHWRRPVE